MRCAFAFWMAASLAAPQDQRTFGVESRLVLVPVTVTGSKGAFVDGLEASDFTLLDNGRPGRIDVDTFGTGVAPIALVVAVQASGISQAVLEKARLVGAMIQPLITGERGCAALVTFSERIQWLEECTNDADRLTAAFEKLRAGGEKSARMLDAVLQAMERLQTRPKSRRVLLLISESRDRSSEASLETVLRAAENASVSVYAATYSAFKTAFTSKSTPAARTPSRSVPPRYDPRNPPRRDREPMPPPPEQRVDILGGIGELRRLGMANTTQVLAERTGGATFAFTRQKGLENAIEKLGAELHSQYLLSFAPADSEPGFHTLEVRVNRPGLTVRARPGYWAK